LEPSLISLDGAITYQNKVTELCNTSIKSIFVVNKYQKTDEAFLSHIPANIEAYTVAYSNRIRRYSTTGFPVKLDYHDKQALEKVGNLNKWR
jgi:hypothetical protein